MNQTFFLIFNHRTKSHTIYPIYRKKKDKSKLKQFSTDLRKKKKNSSSSSIINQPFSRLRIPYLQTKTFFLTNYQSQKHKAK